VESGAKGPAVSLHGGAGVDEVDEELLHAQLDAPAATITTTTNERAIAPSLKAAGPSAAAASAAPCA
jgi:hypothetical protein